MTGERMNKLYVQVVLGGIPEFQDEEEKEFYESLVKEIGETERNSDKPIQWWIPSE